MAIQFSEAVANAMLDQIETTVSTSPTLTIFSGSMPANCAAADSGTALAILTLPSDWMAAAASGSKAKSGTWQDTSADNSGTAGYYRLKASGGTVHQQGTVTATGGGGDLTLDNTNISAGQSVTITSWTWSIAV
jgi:hypothetical protein